MTSGHYGPYVQGVRGNTMGSTKRSEIVRRSKSRKTAVSSDCSLELDYMKLESLVMVDQPSHREYVPVPCTHRPSYHGSCGCLKIREGSRTETMTGVKS